MKKRILYWVAASFVGAMTAACSSNLETEQTLPENNEPVATENTVILTGTLNAKGGDATTRSVDADGHTAWVVSEKIAVYYQKTDDSYATATANVDAVDGAGNATISATLTTPKAGTVKFVYPYSLNNNAGNIDTDKLLNNQLGTIADISANFDAATGSADITVSDGVATFPKFSLANQLCICKYTLKDNSSTAISATKFTISDGTNSYTVTPAAATNEVAVAMLPASSAPFTFLASTGSDYYVKKVASATLAAGKIYASTLKMAEPTLTSIGSGTAGDPWQIFTKAQLVELATTVNGGSNQSGKFFKLMADIDCGSGWTPIGPWPTFNGTFDGNGHNVNYTITDAPTYSGLFGYTDGATIKNLTVSGSISGSNGYCGGVAGYAYNYSTITNCYSSVNVSSYSMVGGIVGSASNDATISYCAASGHMTATRTDGGNNLGGIVGYCYNSSSTRNCTFTGSILPSNDKYRGMACGQSTFTSDCHYLSNSTNNPNGYLGVGTGTTPYSIDEGTTSYATLSALKTAALPASHTEDNYVYYDFINSLTD